MTDGLSSGLVSARWRGVALASTSAPVTALLRVWYCRYHLQVRRLIRVLPRWLYRFQPVFLCLGLFSFFMWGQLGFVGLAGLVLMVLFLLPGQALFWLLSWLAVRRSPDKRLGFSTIPFSVYLLTMLIFYFVLPDVGSDGPDGDRPSGVMRLASVMGVQFERSLSYELSWVFLKVMLVAGALALLAALIDIDRYSQGPG